MKRLLHIAEPFATGVLSFLVDITRRQVESYEIYILYGIRPLTPPNVEELFDKRIHLIKMRSFHGALGTVANPKAYLDVRKWYKRIRPDIVHLHSSASGFVGRWALPCGRLATFYTPHGYSFLMRDSSFAKRKMFWLIEWLSAFRPSTTVACSEGEWREAMKLSKRSVFVNNGINTTELEPYARRFSIRTNRLTVCTSGRIFYQKNPILFNNIAKLLPEVQFVWIGDGDMRNVLDSPNITVTGWLERDKALAVLRDADIFILPSLWEGLPISLLEAMFLEKVCVVSDVIGNRDVIHNGINGLICNSAEDYANAIKALSDGKIAGDTLTKIAANDVAQNYNVELMSQKYDDIYNDGLQKTKH